MKNYLILILLALFSASSFADCPEFATSLEAVMKRVASRDAAKDAAKEETKKAASTATPSKIEYGPSLTGVAAKKDIEAAATARWSTPSASKYKTQYKNESAGEFNNRTFMTLMETDKKLNKNKIYFDVENAVQKKLNDSLIGDKAMVDAINNSFMDKFMANLKEYPELMKRIEGKYKDYKSIRLRLNVGDSGDAAHVESLLSSVYQKTNHEFVAEFENLGLSKLIPPRTDEVPDVSTWFLSGTGDNALEANMAARMARQNGYKMGNSRSVSFAEQVDKMHADVSEIEKLRSALMSDKQLSKLGIMTTSSDGTVIPSKDMIAILRKIKPSDCQDAAEYAAKIRAKVKTAFNSDISDKHIDELRMYFQKVDSLSPPLFQRERMGIDLGQAKNGIVSVDFTGVGVDNAYEQMRALASVKVSEGDKLKVLKDSFSKIQENVDEVTFQMNMSKRAFTVATKDVMNPTLKPTFSGDDGILMPKLNWGQNQKITLVKDLAKTEDPSKFRVTFVKTELNTGAILPVAERSQRVVRAETIEKTVREAVVGAGEGKIASERSKKMIFAIDYTPDKKGGTFNLIIGGAKPTEDEKRIITDAFKKALSIKDDERAGQLIDAY